MKNDAVHKTALATAFGMLLALASGVAMPSPSTSLKKTPQCPTSIDEPSIKLQNIPAGWLPYVASPMYLSSAAPTDGPPQEKGELADYAENYKKNEKTYTYDLDGRYPHGKWLECSYGEYGQISLGQRLDDSITQCAFRYKKGQKAGQKDILVQCK